MLLSGADVEGVVVRAVPPEHPVAPVARPRVAHPREELAPVPRAGVDGPDVAVRPAEHRPPGIRLARLLDGDFPPVQQPRIRHEVRAEHHHAVVVQVPDGQQRTVGVAALGGLLLGVETDVLRVPDLQGGEVGLFFGGGFIGVRVGRIRLVVGLFGCLSLALVLLAVLLFIPLNRPKPHRNHAAVVRPDRRPVPDHFQRIGDPGRAAVQHGHVEAAVHASPRQHVVGRPFVRGVPTRTQDCQIGRVIAPPQAPVACARGVRRAQRAGGSVVQLDPVADIGAGRDRQRQ